MLSKYHARRTVRVSEGSIRQWVCTFICVLPNVCACSKCNPKKHQMFEKHYYSESDIFIVVLINNLRG